MSPPLVLPSPQRTRTSSPPSPPSFAVPAVRSPLILKKSTLPAPSPLSPFLGASLFVFIMVLTHLWFGITVECDLSGHRLPLGKSAVFRSTSSACFYEIDLLLTCTEISQPSFYVSYLRGSLRGRCYNRFADLNQSNPVIAVARQQDWCGLVRITGVNRLK